MRVPLLAVAVLALPIPCAAAPSSIRALPTMDARTVDARFSDDHRPESPGAGVVVIHDGQVALRRAYGLTTPFRAGFSLRGARGPTERPGVEGFRRPDRSHVPA